MPYQIFKSLKRIGKLPDLTFLVKSGQDIAQLVPQQVRIESLSDRPERPLNSRVAHKPFVRASIVQSIERHIAVGDTKTCILGSPQ